MVLAFLASRVILLIQYIVCEYRDLSGPDISPEWRLT